MRECDWKKLKEEDESIMKCVRENMLYNYQGPGWNKYLTEQQILRLVKTGDLFGLMKIDISVEDESLKKRCQEFPPFFKHAEIGRDDIGPHMREFAEETGALKNPQKALISSLKANEWWCATPLLQFYLQLGCTVSKIHEVVQWTPVKCFGKFVDDISNARREADKNPDMKIIGEQNKLKGVYITTTITNLSSS